MLAYTKSHPDISQRLYQSQIMVYTNNDGNDIFVHSTDHGIYQQRWYIPTTMVTTSLSTVRTWIVFQPYFSARIACTTTLVAVWHGGAGTSVYKANNSFLLFGSRMSVQLPGSLVWPDTFLCTPFPLFSWVISVKLSRRYLSYTTSNLERTDTGSWQAVDDDNTIQDFAVVG